MQAQCPAPSTLRARRRTHAVSMSWLRLYAVCGGFCFLVTLALFLCAWLYTLLSGFPPMAAFRTLLGFFTPILLLQMLADVLWSWIMVVLYPTVLGENGIEATTFWGRRDRMAWSAINGAEIVQFWSLPYLKISADGHRAALWVPLFLRRRSELTDALRELAPTDHVVRRVLGA